jgi:hypothetical protein
MGYIVRPCLKKKKNLINYKPRVQLTLFRVASMHHHTQINEAILCNHLPVLSSARWLCILKQIKINMFCLLAIRHNDAMEKELD